MNPNNQPPQQPPVVANNDELKKEVESLKSTVEKLSGNMVSLMNHLGVKHR